MRLLSQSSRQEKTEKREENGLTFAGEGVYCCLETGSASARGTGSELISSYISAKEIVNRPSFNLKNLLPLNRNMPARDQCVFRLAGRFSVVQWQVLGRTYDFTYGNRPAFFVFGRFLKTNSITLIHPQTNKTNLNKKIGRNDRKPLESSQKYRKKFGFPLRKPAFERLTSR